MNHTDDPFQTETMAAILERQGYFDKAAAIYRALLSQAPGRTDLSARLARIEARLPFQPKPVLVELMTEWLELLQREHDLARRLSRMRVR